MDFDQYQTEARKTAKYPGDMGLSYVALGVNGEAGEIAECIKKMYRDDKGELTDSRRQALIKEIGDVLWYLAMLCEEIGVPLDLVARMNVLKLSRRLETNTLHGDGDNREEVADTREQ